MILHSQAGSCQCNGIFSTSEAFVVFQKLLLAHSANNPSSPQQLDVFLGTEARLLADFASMTIFKHYLLYQYCLIFPREVETLRCEVALEAPFAPPNLRRARLLSGPTATTGASTMWVWRIWLLPLRWCELACSTLACRLGSHVRPPRKCMDASSKSTSVMESGHT